MSYRDPSRSAGVSVRRRWATVLTVLSALSLTGYMVSVFEDAEAIHGDFLRALKDSEPCRSSWGPQTFETQLASPDLFLSQVEQPLLTLGVLTIFVLIVGWTSLELLKESGPWLGGPLLLLTILQPPSMLQRLEGHSVVIKHAGSMTVHKSGLLWDGPVYSSELLRVAWSAGSEGQMPSSLYLQTEREHLLIHLGAPAEMEAVCSQLAERYRVPCQPVPIWKVGWPLG